jgi:hypothetical protein
MSVVITCAYCGHTFESETTQEEAEAELKDVFGDVPTSECEVVCNLCYVRLMARRN